MKKRIMHLVTNVSDGGLEKVVYMILSNLNPDKFLCYLVILTNRKSTFIYDKFVSHGIIVKQFSFDNRFANYKSIFKNISQLFKLAYYIKKQKIDILHSHDFFPSFISRTSAIISYCVFIHRIEKIYLTLHNVFFWLNPLHHFINKLLSVITTKIICVSKSVYLFSQTKDKIKPEKYTIIYNGVEVNEFNPLKSFRNKYIIEFGFDEKHFIIGNIGVLSIRKGQKYLLFALKDLIKVHPNLRVIIFGSEREFELNIKNEIFDIIKKFNLSEFVKVINPREDINTIYNMFDVFVMPSITEGLSLCAIEAMLMERICLFSDIEPFAEIVEDGVNGFLFQSKDVESLAGKLKYILDNHDSLGEISQNARTIALLKYNSTEMVKRYEDIYSN